MIIAEILIAIGLLCIIYAVARIAFWAGEKVQKEKDAK